jgi:hypothetical protein
LGTGVGNEVGGAVVGAEIGAGWEGASGSTFRQLPPSLNCTPVLLKVASDQVDNGQPSTCSVEPETVPEWLAPS